MHREAECFGPRRLDMEHVIRDIGERLRGMREIMDIQSGELAEVTGVSEKEYLELEEGRKDFSFTFLYKAALRQVIDQTELITGESPHLTGYSLVRKDQGIPIERRKGFRIAGIYEDAHGSL
jgi:transcriptional regulator with XRE-family HTH domain